MSRRFEENQLRAWTDAQGSGVGDEGDMARDYGIIVGGNPLFVMTNGTDVVFESLGPSAGITYSTITGVITLGIGKTYLLKAGLHFFNFSVPLSQWAGYAFVDLTNARVGYGSVGFSNPVDGVTSSPDANNSCATIHTPTSVANNQVKLRIDAAFSNLFGTANMNGQFCWITIQQMG